MKNHKILYPLAIYCIFMNLAASPWEALSAVYVAEDLNGTPFIHSLLKATTAGGAFLLGFILAKVKSTGTDSFYYGRHSRRCSLFYRRTEYFPAARISRRLCIRGSHQLD